MMSIENISNQITTVDREISNLEREIQNLDTDISRKSKDAAAITEKISREKDIKRFATLSKDLARKNDEINNLEKRKMPKAKLLADKQKKKRDLIVLLNKEEKKERDKSKNEQKEILNIQKQITQEIESRQRISLQSLDKFMPLTVDEKTEKQYDVFISHASEDKNDFVRPFATLLREKGLKVWYDEFELKIGDKLRRKIDEGLSKTRYGVVVLSNFFFAKEWPQKELDGLFAIEDNGQDVILPIWHKISKNEVLRYSPTIAGILALNTSSFSIEEIAEKIVEKVKPNNEENV
ncbi:MAG: hypothetical protein Pg6C_17070 [Treponemataceae bacterium]|nr:MAG: hypothetical protein Pg6C_17070 [Treponemataceae bacterium]